MITANITAYLCMEQLPELKNITSKGVTTPRKQPRFDLVSMSGFWSVLDGLKNYKRQLFFNLIPTDKNEHRKQGGTMPEYYLQCTPAKSKAINFSGVRFEYIERKDVIFASGEPSELPKLKGGVINPMYDRRGDAFLFILTNNMQRLEILIIDGGRLLIDAYRRQLATGGMNEILQTLRLQAKPVNPL